MRAHLPADAVAALVACQARFITILNGRLGILAEIAIGHRLVAATAEGTMRHALAVAIGTGRRAAVGLGAVLCLADRQDRWMQLKHRRLGIVGFVVAAGALGIALENKILGLIRGLGRLRCKCDVCRQTNHTENSGHHEQLP